MSPSPAERDIERALRLLAREFPNDLTAPKAAFFHSVRVGTRLYLDGYPLETVLGGFLHDILEDTSVTEIGLTETFGTEVSGIVKANTKDMSLEKPARMPELIARCSAHSEAAAVVKAADVLDNFRNYSRLGNAPETDRARGLAKALASAAAERGYADQIFRELADISA